MKKRAFAAVLWFYSGWMAGSLLAMVLGVSPALGPIIGVAAAALIAVDPRGMIWTRPMPIEAITESPSGTLSEAA